MIKYFRSLLKTLTHLERQLEIRNMQQEQILEVQNRILEKLDSLPQMEEDIHKLASCAVDNHHGHGYYGPYLKTGHWNNG